MLVPYDVMFCLLEYMVIKKLVVTFYYSYKKWQQQNALIALDPYMCNLGSI